MLYIPLGKALMPVVTKDACEGCDVQYKVCRELMCRGEDREDGEEVVFKLVDLPMDGIK
jgi:hypothetical protein